LDWSHFAWELGEYPRGGGGGPPRLHPHPATKLKLKKKYTDFVDTMMSHVLRDLPFSRNLPLK